MSDSVDPSFDDEEGLPSPPLDEGAFFATQTTSMELSQVSVLFSAFFFFFFSFTEESNLILNMMAEN